MRPALKFRGMKTGIVFEEIGVALRPRTHGRWYQMVATKAPMLRRTNIGLEVIGF